MGVLPGEAPLEKKLKKTHKQTKTNANLFSSYGNIKGIRVIYAAEHPNEKNGSKGSFKNLQT